VIHWLMRWHTTTAHTRSSLRIVRRTSIQLETHSFSHRVALLVSNTMILAASLCISEATPH